MWCLLVSWMPAISIIHCYKFFACAQTALKAKEWLCEDIAKQGQIEESSLTNCAATENHKRTAARTGGINEAN